MTPAGDAALCILLVDDHADTLVPLARLLRRCGYEVAAAGTVSEGLEAAARRVPDVIVSDIALPDGDGCDLLHRIRRTNPAVRGVAVTGLTGNAFEAFLERCRLAGFERFLTKPVVFGKIVEALAELFPHLTRARGLGGTPSPASPC